MTVLASFRTAYVRRVARAVREESPELQNDLRVAAPSRSGEMASNIRVDPSGATTTEITVNVPYASFTRPPGTRPHVIEPANGRALAFFWPVVGRDVVFARVNHPGYQPTSDWYGDVVDEWPDRLSARLSSIPLE